MGGGRFGGNRDEGVEVFFGSDDRIRNRKIQDWDRVLKINTGKQTEKVWTPFEKEMQSLELKI